MAIVKMIGTFGSNTSGDVCGFPDDIARALVDRGIASYHATAPVPVVTADLKPGPPPAPAPESDAPPEAQPEPAAEAAPESLPFQPEPAPEPQPELAPWSGSAEPAPEPAPEPEPELVAEQPEKHERRKRR